MRTINNLQICRAIAAILVLLGHASLLIDPKMFDGFLRIGWCGVDFFFVLSGFIIYYVNYNDFGKPDKFRKYIEKRLFRIYPIYWIYTIIAIMLFIFFYHNHYNIGSIIRSLVLYPFHTELGQYPIIAPAYTLTYEVLFYVLFGIGILRNKKTLIIVFFVWIALISFNMATGVLNSKNTLVAVFLNPLNFEFVFGCLLAHLIISKKFMLNKLSARLLLILGLSLLLISWITQLNDYGILLDNRYLKFGIPFSLIIYAVSILENAGSKNRLKLLFVKLGDASYSIYLIHFVGLYFLIDFLFPHTAFFNSFSKLILSATILILLSYLSYKFIEYPLVKYLKRKAT